MAFCSSSRGSGFNYYGVPSTKKTLSNTFGTTRDDFVVGGGRRGYKILKKLKEYNVQCVELAFWILTIT